MTNSPDDLEVRYFVLINEEERYSLWPTFVDVPAGWTVVYGEETRDACIDYINENWTDMRPTSLIESMVSA